MEKLKPIILGEDTEQNLKTLKKFYKEVWGQFSQEYESNDVFLDKLFDETKYPAIDKDNIKIRVLVLDSMYGTDIHSLSIPHVIDFIAKEHNEINKEKGFTNENICSLIKQCDDKKIDKEISFFTKYCHWYNEVNFKGKNRMPVFDTNAHSMIYDCGLEKSEHGAEYTKKSTNPRGLQLDQCKKNFCNYYTMFNNHYNILHKSDELIEGKSIAYLLDKYLWLNYKIIDAYNNPRKKVRNENRKERTRNQQKLYDWCDKNKEIMNKYFVKK